MARKDKNLENVLIHLLKDLYSAEKQLVKALPKMARAATAEDLKRGFEEHLVQTRGHVERIEKVFQELEGKPGWKKCVGMEGLVKEGEEVMGEDMNGSVMDAGLIAAAQKVEHYEIASYGSARTFAKTLGYNSIAKLLQQTLDEEAAANEKLTRLAETRINRQAAQMKAPA